MWPSGHDLVNYVKRHPSLRTAILPFTKLTPPKLKNIFIHSYTPLGKNMYDSLSELWKTSRQIQDLNHTEIIDKS